MINDVADQKTGRSNEGDDHARHVALPNISADPKPAHRNENRADRVERGIDCGQILDCHSDRAEIKTMPPVLEEPQTQTSAQDRQSTFKRRLTISILRMSIVLAIALGISGGWYLVSKGSRGQWRSRVVEELHRRGVEAAIGHLTLDPFRGLVARDVRIFSYKDRSETLAFISEIALDINYAAFFHHQPFLNALD